MSQSTVRRSYAFFCVFALLTIAANASAAPVAPVGAVSRKTHGSAGTFDIPLPLTGPAGIECRSEGGVHHMVVTFAAPVTLAGASVAVGQGSVSNSSTSGNQVTVDLSGVTNAQRIVIKLSSVSDGVSTNDVEIPMSVLLGDVNGDGYVLSGDYTAVRQHSGAAADGNTFKFDINADGFILSGDYTTVRGQSGMSLSWSAPSLDRLATGNDSVSLVLKPDTSLWSWGTHPGDGSTQPRSYPLALTAVPNPVSLSAGSAHAAVLASDGVVWSWGANQQGQIGDGTIGDSNSPVAMLSNVIAVKAGGFHTLALLQDGTVASWGKNNYGQLGKGDTTSSVVPVAVSNLTSVKQVAAGYERSLALKTDGTLWRWGLEKNDPTVPETIFNATPSQVTGLTNVTAIAAGLAHAVAVKSDGTIWAWGSNQNGELGNSSVTGYSATPVQVSNVANAIAVSSSFDHTLALCSDGTVWAWGANNSGQLGNGTTNFTSVPVQVSGLTDVVAIAAARSYSMALKSDGTVVAWGENTLLLGIAPGSNNLVPQQAVLQLLDLNANGIDDRWEMQYFGNLNQTASGDFDGDGISNLQEFQNGTIPNDWYNGATPYPVFRAHNRAAAKTKQGFPTFIVVNPIRFFLKQVNTTSIEGGNPESPVGGVITTTVDDLDTGHTTEERSGNPIDFTYAPWGVSESYANNYATRIRIQHTQDAAENPGAYDDPPNQVTDLAATLTENIDRTNEYTTDMLIGRAIAALPPLPPMDDPYNLILDDQTFATIHVFPGETTVYATHSEYRFEWHVSPHLPAFKQITWLEKFVPKSGTPTITVRHWEGTSNQTDTYTLEPTAEGNYYIETPSADFKAQDGKINSGFDPRTGNNADGIPGGEPWASVVKGSDHDVVKLVIPAAAQLVKLLVKADANQPVEVDVVQKNGFVNGDNYLTLKGLAGNDSVTTATIEAHLIDGDGNDTGQVIAKLHVMALPPRTVSLGIYRVADSSSPATGTPPPSPTDSAILTRLNDVYAQAGITFVVDDAQSLPNVPFDRFVRTDAGSEVQAYDGLVQPNEFPVIAQSISSSLAKLHLVLANNSGDSSNQDYKPPYVRGDTDRDPDINFSIVFTVNSGAVADLIGTHELGHLLRLSAVAPGNPHDPGPFPSATQSMGGGLMHAGTGDDQPGLWLAHQDWQKANETAAAFAH